MKKRALLIDAFSTVHVGNGALVDNTYKLVKEFFGENVDVLTIDVAPNIGRFPHVYEDIFCDYQGSKWSKLKVAILVSLVSLVEVPNAVLTKGRFHFPWPARIRDQLNVIEKSSVCVSLSGETINDHYYPHMYLRLLFYWIAILQGKKFVLFPQSIGPVFRPISKLLLRLCLGKSEYAIARDRKSYETAKELWKGCPIQIVFSPDVAVTQDSTVVKISVRKTNKQLLGLTVSDIPRAEMDFKGEYLEDIAESIRRSVDASKFEIVLMPSNYAHGRVSSDYKQCLKAKSLLEGLGYDVCILDDRIYHPEEYQGMQRSLYAFITTRMHVGILGTSAGVPTIMINTQHKIRAYMNLIGREDCVVELSELREKLDGAITYVIQDNARLRSDLVAANSKLREEVRRVVRQVLI